MATVATDVDVVAAHLEAFSGAGHDALHRVGRRPFGIAHDGNVADARGEPRRDEKAIARMQGWLHAGVLDAETPQRQTVEHWIKSLGVD